MLFILLSVNILIVYCFTSINHVTKNISQESNTHKEFLRHQFWGLKMLSYVEYEPSSLKDTRVEEWAHKLAKCKIFPSSMFLPESKFVNVGQSNGIKRQICVALNWIFSDTSKTWHLHTCLFTRHVSSSLRILLFSEVY